MRIALGIEYSGENDCGWQRQSHSPSVQENLDKVLTTIANQPIKTFCAGRTDPGVHASGQVIHFDLDKQRPITACLRGANNQLPRDIAIKWAVEVNDDFHARFSATERSYRYVIYNNETPTAILARKVTWHRRSLDVDSMQSGANYLIGKFNFSSFRASSCQANTPIRNITELKLSQKGKFIFIDISANAFLHHMVRNIVGSLLLVGEGRRSPIFIKQTLQQLDRTKAPDTAKP
ncbi:MAG: tRNA pseudouridine(38-40) synthase TruA, partial [Kangiellaceae bacterium]|nr:tRNA pseudouridine(38-40) synthase TruA [Kangiellaceae bacterium]